MLQRQLLIMVLVLSSILLLTVPGLAAQEYTCLGTEVVFSDTSTFDINCDDFNAIASIYENRENHGMVLTFDELSSIVQVDVDLRVTELRINGKDGGWGRGLLRVVPGLRRMIHLATLDLNDNSIVEFYCSRLPDSIRVVDLSGNRILDFYAEDCPSGLINLDLSSNLLRSIDTSLSLWGRSFASLNLSNNDIGFLPADICGTAPPLNCTVCRKTCFVCPQRVRNAFCAESELQCTLAAWPDTGIEPLPVAFTWVAPDAVPVHLDFGDGSSTDSFADPSHQYAAAGEYVPTLTVASASDPSETAQCSKRILVQPAGTEPENHLPLVAYYYADCDTIALEVFDADLEAHPELFLVDVYLAGAGSSLMRLGRFSSPTGPGDNEITITAATAEIPWPTGEEAEQLMVWVKDFNAAGASVGWQEAGRLQWSRTSCDGGTVDEVPNELPTIDQVFRDRDKVLLWFHDPDIEALGLEHRVDVYLNDEDHKLLQYQGQDGFLWLDDFTAAIPWPEQVPSEPETLIVWMKDLRSDGLPAQDPWVGPVSFAWDRSISCQVSPTLDGIIPLADGLAPLAVTFVSVAGRAGSGTGSLTGTSIDFGDGTVVAPATGSNLQHTYTEPGEYTAVLTINSSSNCAVNVTAR